MKRTLRWPRSKVMQFCSIAREIRFRSEEHTSELQSLTNLVCRLLLEKNNTGINHPAERFDQLTAEEKYIRLYISLRHSCQNIIAQHELCLPVGMNQEAYKIRKPPPGL